MMERAQVAVAALVALAAPAAPAAPATQKYLAGWHPFVYT